MVQLLSDKFTRDQNSGTLVAESLLLVDIRHEVSGNLHLAKDTI